MTTKPKTRRPADEAPSEPLTFLLGPPEIPDFQRTVTVGPLDTDHVPDAPQDEQVEVILAADVFDQVLNRRYYEAKRKIGQQVPRDFHERHLGDRFLLDTRQLPRLLESGAVRLPEELEVDSSLDEQAAELEAQRAEIEQERTQRTSELRDQARREALERDAAVRANAAEMAAEAEREAMGEIAEAIS